MIKRRDLITATAATAVGVLTSSSIVQAANDARGNAIHFTAFNFKDDLSDSDRDRILGVVRDLGKMREVKHLVIGHKVQTKTGGPNNFGYISIVGFDNVADHDAYMVSARRMAMGKQFMPSQSGWIAADTHHPGLAKLWATKENRIRHCVLFSFKDEIEAAERDRLVTAVRALEKLPMAKAVTLSRNTQKKSDNSPAEWVFLADFANAEDMKNFQNTPEHLATVQNDLVKKLSLVISADLEITPAITGK